MPTRLPPFSQQPSTSFGDFHRQEDVVSQPCAKSLLFSIAFASAFNSSLRHFVAATKSRHPSYLSHCALEAVITSSKLFETTSNGKFQGDRAKAEDNLVGDMIDLKNDKQAVLTSCKLFETATTGNSQGVRIPIPLATVLFEDATTKFRCALEFLRTCGHFQQNL